MPRFKIGDMVSSKNYGQGIVRAIRRSGDYYSSDFTVQFDSGLVFGFIKLNGVFVLDCHPGILDDQGIKLLENECPLCGKLEGVDLSPHTEVKIYTDGKSISKMMVSTSEYAGYFKSTDYDVVLNDVVKFCPLCGKSFG